MSTDTQPRYIPPHLRFDDAPIIERLNALELSLYRQSPAFRRLRKLKHQAIRVPRGENASKKVPSSVTVFRDQFERVMGEINDQSGGALSSVHSFLDLGCAPGGFSTWVLKNNEACRGAGVSIGADENGWELVQAGWRESMLERYEFLEADIRDETTSVKIQGMIQALGTCDLVIACAVLKQQGATEAQEEQPEQGSKYTALQISQLVLALRSLKEGGCLVAAMTSKPSPMRVTLILLLKQIFESVITTRGKTLHRARGSYYLVCKSRKADVSTGLEKLEAALAGGFEHPWSMNWLAFLGDAEKSSLTGTEEGEILDHLEPVWESQADSMEMASNGRSGPGRGGGSKRGGRGGRGRVPPKITA